MELITILNRCHRFRGFVYQHARFSADQKSIEVSVRPRKGSAAICSRCHQTAPGYDQLAERRFEFIPLWASRSVSYSHQVTPSNSRRRCPLRIIETLPQQLRREVMKECRELLLLLPSLGYGGAAKFDVDLNA